MAFTGKKIWRKLPWRYCTSDSCVTKDISSTEKQKRKTLLVTKTNDNNWAVFCAILHWREHTIGKVGNLGCTSTVPRQALSCEECLNTEVSSTLYTFTIAEVEERVKQIRPNFLQEGYLERWSWGRARDVQPNASLNWKSLASPFPPRNPRSACEVFTMYIDDVNTSNVAVFKPEERIKARNVNKELTVVQQKYQSAPSYYNKS